MAENKKRSVFGFHGIFGIMISIFGLLFIAAVIISQAVLVQQGSAKEPYDPAPIRDVNNLKMISVDNKQYAFQPKKDQ